MILTFITDDALPFVGYHRSEAVEGDVAFPAAPVVGGEQFVGHA